MFSLVFIILIFFSCLILGGIVYFQNPKKKINQIFTALTVFIIFWLGSNFLENTDLSQETASLFLKIDFATAAILAYFFFLFSITFQTSNLISLKTKLSQILFFIPTFIFSILSFTDLVVKNIRFEEQRILFDIGLLFPFYALVLFSYMGIGCVDLISKYRKFKGIQKIQTFYILLGFSLSAVIALIINIFFQQNVSVGIFRIGNYGIIFFVGFTTYAILKHHLLNIKVIFTEISVVAISLILLIQIFTSQTIFEYIWKTILFLIFLLFGYFLIRSVIQEIERRKEIQKLYQEVDKLNKAKSEFLSIASHQLRTPLTVVKGYISLILEKNYGEVPEKMTQPLKNIHQSNERLLNLVNDLLNLSRLEAGRIKFTTSSISLEKLVSNIVEELQINTDKKGLSINIEKPSKPLPNIIADKDKLRQIILNIIDNAIKYTDKGGITIKFKKTPLTEEVLISDTGTGMTREEVDAVFQMFTRTTAGLENNKEGYGVGLYVAKKFIDMHNGKIWIESQGKGKGTTFHIELPIKQIKKDEKNIK